jgi:hypothetical protein
MEVRMMEAAAVINFIIKHWRLAAAAIIVLAAATYICYLRHNVAGLLAERDQLVAQSAIANANAAACQLALKDQNMAVQMLSDKAKRWDTAVADANAEAERLMLQPLDSPAIETGDPDAAMAWLLRQAVESK